jgi:hypothetical protein
MGQTSSRNSNNLVQLGPGQPKPHGCSQTKGGSVVNFSLLAPGSSSAWLVFSLPSGHPAKRLFQTLSQKTASQSPKAGTPGSLRFDSPKSAGPAQNFRGKVLPGSPKTAGGIFAQSLKQSKAGADAGAGYPQERPISDKPKCF